MVPPETRTLETITVWPNHLNSSRYPLYLGTDDTVDNIRYPGSNNPPVDNGSDDGHEICSHPFVDFN